MRIEKRPYSVNPWRLIDSQGLEVQALPERFDHPDLGATVVTGSVSGATRKECETNALRLLEALITRRTALDVAHGGRYSSVMQSALGGLRNQMESKMATKKPYVPITVTADQGGGLIMSLSIGRDTWETNCETREQGVSELCAATGVNPSDCYTTETE